MSFIPGLTDDELRASPVPVSGPLTDFELRASAVTVSVLPPTAIRVDVNGFNPAVGAAYENIDTLGAATPYMPTAAVSIEALSTNANDTAAGTGARTILVTGLNGNFDQQTETITLNGVGVVAGANQYIRVLKVEVITVGTYGGTNAGTITVRQSGGGTIFQRIEIGYSRSMSAHYCVPRGYYLNISGADLTNESSKPADVTVISRDNANIVAAPYTASVTQKQYRGVVGVNHFDYEVPVRASEMTDIYIIAAYSAGTTGLTAEYWGWIMPL